MIAILCIPLCLILMANVAKLQEKLNKIQQQLKVERRKADLRGKMLYGTALLRAVNAEKIKPEYLHQLLNKFITKPADREFLKLPPLPKPNSNGVENNNSHSPEHSHQ